MEPGAETGRATDGKRAVNEAEANRIAELESAAAEGRELRRLLVEAEQRLAELPELRRRSEELERVRTSLEWRVATALRVSGRRAKSVWLPALRRRVKQLLGAVVRVLRS
jgi:hypothetical protein